jgi:hypothetical protein
MPRKFWNRFPFQSEENGDLGDSSAASATTETIIPEKVYSAEFVAKLRESERKAAKEAAEAKRELAEARAAKEESEAAKKGDYEALKQRTLEDNAKIRSEKDKAIADKDKQLNETTAKYDNRLKRASLKAAFKGVFNPDAIDDMLANEAYYKALKVVEDESGEESIIVIDGDKDPRFKVVAGKTLPFTIDDFIEELAQKKPNLALARNQSSGDGMPARNGRRFKDGIDPSKMSAQERIAYGRSLGQK